MDAEDLLLREFLGIRTAQQTSAAARWIRSCQRADGTWANFRGGEADLSTTVEAYVALRLAGDAPEDGHMARAADWVRGASPGAGPRNSFRPNGKVLTGRSEPTMVSGTMVWRAQHAQSYTLSGNQAGR